MTDKFRMLIANIYSLPNGPAVTGRIESGMVRLGDSLTLDGACGKFPVKVIFIERFQEALTEANSASDLVGLTLSGIDFNQIRNRDLLLDDVS